MSTTTDLTTLKINYLTQAQYDAAVSGGTINENEIYMTPAQEKLFITPQMFGAAGDGVTDDTTAIQAALNSGNTVIFPEGVYLVSSPLTIHQSIVGVGAPRMGGSGSVIKCGFSTAGYLVNFTDSDSSKGLCIDSIAFDCQSKSGGINYAPTMNRPPIKISNVSVWNHGSRGININPGGSTSRCAMMSNISVTGGTETAECCIYIGSNASDCSLSDFVLMHCRKGIITYGPGLRLNNGHMYAGRSNLSDLDTYWSNTIGVYAMSNVMASNVYVDSFLQGWVQLQGSSEIGTFFSWYDSVFASATNKSATVVKADDTYTASITIGALTIGGNRTIIGTLMSGNVKYGNLTLKGWTELPSESNGYAYGQTPYMLPGLGSNQYHLRKYGATWTIVGAVYLGTTGTAILRVSRSQLAGDVVVKFDGTTATVTGHKVLDAGAMVLYYSRSGRFLYLWGYPYTDVNVRSLLSTNKLNMGESVCGVDISTMPDWTHVTQSDTTGLTQIAFS